MADKEISYTIIDTPIDTEGQLPRRLTDAEIAEMAAILEYSALRITMPFEKYLEHQALSERHRYFMGEFALILAAKGHAVDYQTVS